MNRKTQGESSFSSSSAFIIIIILVVVSVAAIIVGGGDGFTRKYAGIDFKSFNTQSVLAQTGVVGKNLEFEQIGDGYTLKLNPIELDGEVLGVDEKYVASVVPPLEGDSPFWYRTSVGNEREAQGYPIKRSFVTENNLNEEDATQGDFDPIEVIPGMVDCSINPGTENGFEVFFEDIAYETGLGFDHPDLGQGRRDAICETLQEFEIMLNLDEDGLRPGIVVQASEDKTPLYSLSVVAPQYVGGSGFVSTLLADYLRTGVRRSSTSFTDDVSVLGINSGFVRYNFEDVNWSVDTGNTEDYDLKTVTRQNMLRLLGFGSFVGHEQENILSSAWKRWTEWDRMLFSQEFEKIIDTETLDFKSVANGDYTTQTASAEDYDQALTGGEGGNLVILGGLLPDEGNIPASQQMFEVETPNSFQKGQSVSGLADENAVSNPILRAGEIKTVTQAEKEVLCLLGLSVDGIAGCGAPRSVIENKYIERENNRTVCVDLFDQTYNAFTENFELVNPLVEKDALVDTGDSSVFIMYDAPCEEDDFNSNEEKAEFDAQHATQNYQEAVAFSWKPKALEDDTWSEYVRFEYRVKDAVSGRVTDPGEIAIHKCVITAQSNQLCNGDFEYSSAQSPVDFQLSTMEDQKKIDPLTGVTLNLIGCSSTTAPGWCGQGTPDVFSSEFGYTWHPYFIQNNPEAFDDPEKPDEDGIKNYAGGVAGEILVQRLRVPLSQHTAYQVSGRVLSTSTESGQHPKIWYRTESDVQKQSDGSYHVDHPNVDAVGEFDLLPNSETLVADEWQEFTLSFNPGSEIVTHIAFGGTDHEGRIFFDDLSIKTASGCGECFGDSNGDCAVNAVDFISFLSYLGSACPNETIGCLFDMNFDGVRNSGDLISFLSTLGGFCEIDEEGPVADLGSNIIALSDEDTSVGNSSLDIDYTAVDGLQVVPNSQGFRSNLKIRVKNIDSKDISDLNLIGVIPSQLEYEGHVATQENTAYKKSSNSVFISGIDQNEELELYFNVKLIPSICAEVQRKESSRYNDLVDLGLCDSYQILLEKQYGIQRDKQGNIIYKRSSGSGSGAVVEDGEPGGPPADPTECSDGLDNDGDGLVDGADSDCESTADTSEGDEKAQCTDGEDNDGDGRTDYPDDPQCTSRYDNDESVR